LCESRPPPSTLLNVQLLPLSVPRRRTVSLGDSALAPFSQVDLCRDARPLGHKASPRQPPPSIHGWTLQSTAEASLSPFRSRAQHPACSPVEPRVWAVDPGCRGKRKAVHGWGSCAQGSVHATFQPSHRLSPPGRLQHGATSARQTPTGLDTRLAACRYLSDTTSRF
jgi:hypothetical protein